MAETLRLTLAQLNPTLGDLAGNAEKVRAAWAKGRAAGADLVAFPEMFVTGYNAQDLFMRPGFQHDAIDMVDRLAADCAVGPALAVGAPFVEDGRLYNAYHVCAGGTVVARILKHHLPNDMVFDEKRIFDSGRVTGPFVIGPARLGSPICEDAWFDDVAETLAETGAEILLVPNGSPYYRGKQEVRLNHMVARTVETGLPLVYLNMVGGQDDQVFDGGSFVLNPGGQIVAQLPVFEDTIAHVDFDRTPGGWRARAGDFAQHPDEWEQDYHAMVVALRDYCAKSGFDRVVLGLSGGIDSALVATIAADALGPDAVRCVMLPSDYTAPDSLQDAEALARNLGADLHSLPIGPGRDAITETLAPLFQGRDPDVTEENMQSRLRGLVLMALSNKFGEMLLTTGNKSEVAVGYSTIYGDMAGGYNPIKDLYKTRVFETCRWRNANHRDWMKGPTGAVIPDRIITKPPTAELRADQKDSDSLPDYGVLDRMLEILVDADGTVADCVAEGFDEAEAQRVERLVLLSEYKRFQSAPGARLTPRAFWLDRRYPIVNRWRS